jgi:hypothetical protein
VVAIALLATSAARRRRRDHRRLGRQARPLSDRGAGRGRLRRRDRRRGRERSPASISASPATSRCSIRRRSSPISAPRSSASIRRSGRTSAPTGSSSTASSRPAIKVELEARLYEVSQGRDGGPDQDLPRHQGRPAVKLTHAWCNEVVKYYTGEYGFFGSRLTYVAKKRGASTVMVADFDGASPYAVTRNSSINLLPAWSPGGGSDRVHLVHAQQPRPVRGRRRRRSAQEASTSYKGMNTGASVVARWLEAGGDACRRTATPTST